MTPTQLALLAYAMIIVFMALLMTKRMSVIVALILVRSFLPWSVVSGLNSGP